MTDYHDQIHELWDRLADWPVADAEAALRHLMDSLSLWLDSDHCYWLSAYRMSDNKKDPLFGWRAGPVFYPYETPLDTRVYEAACEDMETGVIDEGVFNHVRQAGEFRAVRLRDHVSPDYLNSAQFHRHYGVRGLGDALFVVAPVNSDTEVYFCFSRAQAKPRFTPQDLEIPNYCLRSLKWFFKQVLLGQGLMIAAAPLTATEKEILALLLTDLSEKQIASRLQKKPDTTHKHVLSIYRKYNVNSRAGLMAIWLGQPVR